MLHERRKVSNHCPRRVSNLFVRAHVNGAMLLEGKAIYLSLLLLNAERSIEWNEMRWWQEAMMRKKEN